MSVNEKTSKKVSRIASKLLKNPKTSKQVKSVAASALTQSPDRKKINIMNKTIDQTMKTAIGIAEKNRLSAASELSKILADETVLYIKTKNAHWNIEGPDFYDKHKFFETQFEQIDEIIDDVAERIRAIGHYAPATMKSYLSITHLTERVSNKNNSQGFIKELLTDHENIIMILRENIKPFTEDFQDIGTADFVTGLMEKHEKMAWFLRAHLNN